MAFILGALVMKNFIIGFITALVIGAWVTLAVVGVISVKVAIIAPVCLVLGVCVGVTIIAAMFAP